MITNAVEKLNLKCETNLHICVGLDTDIKKVPVHLRKKSNPVLEFNRSIIDATKNSAAAYKINFAFYEKDGLAGLNNLIETVKYIPDEILIIGDAKRGDIGNTSRMYAQAVFEHFNCDAVTLHPYMGFDSIEPFASYKDKLNFILALTSNEGADDFEKQTMHDGNLLFQNVIKKIHEWNENKNCGLVFGATQIDELKENIELIGELPVLLPGIGAQGGSLEDVANVFSTMNKNNYLVNVSRALIYCSAEKDFADKITMEIRRLNETVKKAMADKK